MKDLYGNWLYSLIGVLYLVAGYMLWTGAWDLNQAVAAILILWGVKKLSHGCCMPMKK